SATILIASATSYKNYHDTSADPAALATDSINKAAAKGYDALLKDHLAEHEKLFNRVSLKLFSNEILPSDLPPTVPSPTPTDQRIRDFRTTNAPQPAALSFQSGRYPPLPSPRPGSQPANLQGVWNDLTSPPWGSKYTININTEMNYWPV